MTWVPRVLGMFLVFFGINALFAPLSALAYLIPFLESLVGGGAAMVFLSGMDCLQAVSGDFPDRGCWSHRFSQTQDEKSGAIKLADFYLLFSPYFPRAICVWDSGVRVPV